ncbi:hypothetical protein LXL04_028900 [Taraxacum kok-saghyz]
MQLAFNVVSTSSEGGATEVEQNDHRFWSYNQQQINIVGHAGTLDSMATGLLIVCIGKATKLVDRFQGMVKGYSGVLRLGEATSTLDADSPLYSILKCPLQNVMLILFFLNVIQREPWEHIKDDDIKKTATSFCGEIWQVPPMFSAIKVGGERLYEKARRGENVELSPRRISIFQFDVERSLEDRLVSCPDQFFCQWLLLINHQESQ